MAFSLTALDKTASDLFKASIGNFKTFEANLRKAGVDAVDARLVTEKYRKELTATRRELLGLGDDAKKTSRSMREIATGALRSIGEKAMNVPGMLVSGAVGAVGTIADKVVDVGKSLVDSVLEAAQFKQNSIQGLESMLGTRKEAENIFKQAQQLALATPLDTKEVISGITQLVTAGGFKGDEATMLYKLIADQAALNLNDKGMQGKVIAAFSRVKGRGVATGEDLESMRVAGFNELEIMKSLRQKKNLAPLFKGLKANASDEEMSKEVKKVLGSGKIGATSFLNAVIASSENKRNKNIGDIASEFGEKSLTGTISNFKSSFEDLLGSVNVDKWEGVKKFQDFLTRITKMMQGDTGQGLLKTVENISNALLGGLQNIKDSDIKSFVETLGKLGEKAVNLIKEAWGWLKQMLDAKPGAFLDATKGALIEAGVYIGKGLLQGVASGAAGIFNVERYSSVAQGSSSKAWGNLWDDTGGAAWRGIKGAWNSKESTSLTTSLSAAQAGYSDLDIPKFGDGAMVTSPTLAWVGESGPEAVVPLRTMAGSGETYSSLSSSAGSQTASSSPGGRGIRDIYVDVKVGSLSGMGDPTEAANTIADITVERVLMAILERKALEA